MKWVVSVFRVIGKTIKALLLLGFCLAMIGAGLIAAVCGPTIYTWMNESIDIAEKSERSDFRTEETSYIYGSDGSVLLKLRGEKDVEYVEFADLPKTVVDAFVSIEDKRFYEHRGVDWASTAKAAYLLLRNSGEISRGGSTITQQLARNVYLTFETSYERKIREIFLALALERVYSKDDILEFYTNSINFGNGYYGIGAAANGYFGKSVKDLSLSETAFLCAIPNNPTYYNPRQNYKHTMTRRDVILQQMYEQDKITCKQYTTALNDVVVLAGSESVLVSDYAASYALNCVVKEFMEMRGFSFEYDWETQEQFEVYRQRYDAEYEEALRDFRTGGYRVVTSLDADIQKSAQEAVDSELEGFTGVDDTGVFTMQGAVTVIENSTGMVLASVGGRSGEATTLGLNRAFQSYKQPGSTIKPLAVYTPAMEYGYTANSAVDDSPIEDGPKNSDNKYSGRITLRRAVEQSKNVVAWRLFEEITPRRGLAYLQSMQFTRIVPDDFYPAASLGGLTYGVTTEEMAGGYAALANGGVWQEPTCISSIVNTDGKELYSKADGKRVYASLAANSMTDVLSGVKDSGTARGLRLENNSEFACKTGTTNSNKAAWFCGYTKEYSVAVYVGADDNQTAVEGLWGSTYPARIWVKVQDALLSDAESQSLLTDEQRQRVEEHYANDEKALVVQEQPQEIVPADESVGQPVEQVEEQPVEQVEQLEVPAEVGE